MPKRRESTATLHPFGSFLTGARWIEPATALDTLPAPARERTKCAHGSSEADERRRGPLTQPGTKGWIAMRAASRGSADLARGSPQQTRAAGQSERRISREYPNLHSRDDSAGFEAPVRFRTNIQPAPWRCWRQTCEAEGSTGAVAIEGTG